MLESSKEQHLFEIKICNIINVFIVTLINASLLNKSINFLIIINDESLKK